MLERRVLWSWLADLAMRVGGAAGSILRTRLLPGQVPLLRHLQEEDPRAFQAAHRWRSVHSVPVSEIVGSASVLPGTRRADFLPTCGHEPADWRSRWSRLQAATACLTPLPPIKVLKSSAGYWVVDGHNRVAMARSVGQVYIRADVTEVLSLPLPVGTPQRGLAGSATVQREPLSVRDGLDIVLSLGGLAILLSRAGYASHPHGVGRNARKGSLKATWSSD